MEVKKDYKVLVRSATDTIDKMKELAKKNERSLNGEINIAFEKHLSREFLGDGILKIKNPRIAKALKNHPKCKK